MLVAEDPTPRVLTGSIRCVTDDELVLLARQGDTAAFDQLVVRHQVAVYRAAMAALRNTDEAEEAAQDAFVRAWSQPAPEPVPGVQCPRRHFRRFFPKKSRRRDSW